VAHVCADAVVHYVGHDQRQREEHQAEDKVTEEAVTFSGGKYPRSIARVPESRQGRKSTRQSILPVSDALAAVLGTESGLGSHLARTMDSVLMKPPPRRSRRSRRPGGPPRDGGGGQHRGGGGGGEGRGAYRDGRGWAWWEPLLAFLIAMACLLFIPLLTIIARGS
jgi:hypothetical protein